MENKLLYKKHALYILYLTISETTNVEMLRIAFKLKKNANLCGRKKESEIKRNSINYA